MLKKAILLLLIILFGLLSLAIYQKITIDDSQLHVIFCDVGQGDGILITKGLTQILVDGGPDNKILSCLSRHMVFWDRKIEVVLLTHPQTDHFTGLISVLRNYNVNMFLHPDVEGTSEAWKVFKEELASRGVDNKIVTSGDKITIANLHFDIFNPSSSLLGASPSTDLNDYSVVGILSYGNFDTLLTGDIQPPQIDTIVPKLRPIEVLKVPHHGSKNGLTTDFLYKASPSLAVICVGKNNRYGHPNSEVIKLLNEHNIKTLRTDQDGEVEVISNGDKWWVN